MCAWVCATVYVCACVCMGDYECVYARVILCVNLYMYKCDSLDLFLGMWESIHKKKTKEVFHTGLS